MQKILQHLVDFMHGTAIPSKQFANSAQNTWTSVPVQKPQIKTDLKTHSLSNNAREYSRNVFFKVIIAHGTLSRLWIVQNDLFFSSEIAIQARITSEVYGMPKIQ